MNDTSDTSSVTPAAASPATPHAAPTTPHARIHVLPVVALLVAVLALAAAAWSWSDSREHIRDLKTELARRLADSGKDVNETRLLARNADDSMRQVSEKVARIENQMVSSQQQQLALETLYRDMAQGRGDLLAILSVGAYGMSMASNYNSRPRAAEVMIDKNEFHLVRERESHDSMMAGERLFT